MGKSQVKEKGDSLIYTDRSRYLRGLKHCQRARFLSTHYKGHGLRPKAEASAVMARMCEEALHDYEQGQAGWDALWENVERLRKEVEELGREFKK